MNVVLIAILFPLQIPTEREAVLEVVQAFFDTMTSKDVAGGVYTLESKCEPSPLGPLKQ